MSYFSGYSDMVSALKSIWKKSNFDVLIRSKIIRVEPIQYLEQTPGDVTVGRLSREIERDREGELFALKYVTEI